MVTSSTEGFGLLEIKGHTHGLSNYSCVSCREFPDENELKHMTHSKHIYHDLSFPLFSTSIS